MLFEDKVEPDGKQRTFIVDWFGEMESKLHKNIDGIKMVMTIELSKYCLKDNAQSKWKREWEI